MSRRFERREDRPGFSPSPFQGEGWGEGVMVMQRYCWARAFTLTPTLSLEGRGSQTLAFAVHAAAEGGRI
jgi:hypothetical protein